MLFAAFLPILALGGLMLMPLMETDSPNESDDGLDDLVEDGDETSGEDETPEEDETDEDDGALDDDEIVEEDGASSETMAELDALLEPFADDLDDGTPAILVSSGSSSLVNVLDAPEGTEATVIETNSSLTVSGTDQDDTIISVYGDDTQTELNLGAGADTVFANVGHNINSYDLDETNTEDTDEISLIASDEALEELYDEKEARRNNTNTENLYSNLFVDADDHVHFELPAGTEGSLIVVMGNIYDEDATSTYVDLGNGDGYYETDTTPYWDQEVAVFLAPVDFDLAEFAEDISDGGQFPNGTSRAEFNVELITLAKIETSSDQHDTENLDFDWLSVSSNLSVETVVVQSS